MSFPVGEQFFMDSVRTSVSALPPPQQPQFSSTLKGFVGQEATHRRLHGLYNAQLLRVGIPDTLSNKIAARIQTLSGKNPKHALAITAAYEHITAVFSEWFLQNQKNFTPLTFDSVTSDLHRLWLWHCSEEVEHRTVAFDVYLASGGNHRWRVMWYKRVLLLMASDTLAQMMAHLKTEGQLYSFDTVKRAFQLFFGGSGLIRTMFQAFYDYTRPNFHPKLSSALHSTRWLKDNSSLYSVI
jgi:uncharacterized protein